MSETPLPPGFTGPIQMFGAAPALHVVNVSLTGPIVVSNTMKEVIKPTTEVNTGLKSPQGSHYVWYFFDPSNPSKDLDAVWSQAESKYRNLGYTRYDYTKFKELADSLGCTETPSFAFWYLTKLSFVSLNPTPAELDNLLRIWNFA